MINQFKVQLPCASETVYHQAKQFSQSLSLDIVQRNCPENEKQAVFEWIGDKLFLNLLLDSKVAQLAFDFADGEVGFRAARVSKSNEVVSKAIGCKPYFRPKVLDATAGMGRDSLIMALLGCEVVMQERNFAIYHLLENALTRFKKEPVFSDVSQKVSLWQRNSIDSFQNIGDTEVIYLDPMFPQRKKSALVKKEMRLFKLLAGEDPDADLLLKNALLSTAKRVVVKRPKGACELMNKKPSHKIVAKKFHYDVYLK